MRINRGDEKGRSKRRKEGRNNYPDAQLGKVDKRLKLLNLCEIDKHSDRLRQRHTDKEALQSDKTLGKEKGKGNKKKRSTKQTDRKTETRNKT